MHTVATGFTLMLIPHRRIQPGVPHMQQIKILLSNYFIQHPLVYTLMMNQ